MLRENQRGPKEDDLRKFFWEIEKRGERMAWVFGMIRQEPKSSNTVGQRERLKEQNYSRTYKFHVNNSDLLVCSVFSRQTLGYKYDTVITKMFVNMSSPMIKPVWVLGSEFWGLGFAVWVLRSGFWGLGFGVWVLRSGFWGLGFAVWVLRSGFWGLDFGVWVLGFWFFGVLVFWGLGFGVWVLGSGFWVRVRRDLFPQNKRGVF